MGTIKQLRVKSEARVDPLRQRLADALKEAEAGHQAVARCRAGIERARAAKRAGETAVKASEEAVKTAQKDHAAAIAKAAADDAPPPASAVRAARQAAIDAADELGAAEGAVAELKTSLPGLIADARTADIGVEAAISAILAPEAKALLVRARSVQKLLMPLKRALAQLFERLPVPMDEALAFQRSRRPLEGIQAEVRKFFETIDADGGDRANPWSAARELLRADPHAELPFIAPPLPPSDEDETAAHQNRAI